MGHYRWGIAAACGLLLAGHAAGAAAPAEAAREVVASFNRTLLEAMQQGPELGYQGRFELLEPAVTSTFALTFMARKSVGRAWNEFDDAQKAAYLAKYVQWSVATFAGRFKKWGGEEFEILVVSGPDRGTVTVESQLTKRDGETVSFRYMLREGTTGWRVVDLHIDGVSQLALTRSQYVQVLNDEGFDGLLRLLDEKIQEQRTDAAA